MDLFFLPSISDRFLPRHYSPFENQLISKHWGLPFDIYDEDFLSLNCPFPLTRRHVSFIVPKGRIFKKKEETKSQEEESSENKQENEDNKQSTSEDKTTKNEEVSHQMKDKNNLFKTLMPLEEIFPNFGNFSSLLQTREDGRFEVNVNLHGCDPNKVKLEIKDGILKVEGKKESADGSFTYVRHEQTIPKNVSSKSLTASLLPEGVLKVRQNEQRYNIPITLATGEEIEPQKDIESDLPK